VYRPNTLLLDNALATMGAGLPSALAAKLVHPDRAVLAVVGDGGFMMNSQARTFFFFPLVCLFFTFWVSILKIKFFNYRSFSVDFFIVLKMCRQVGFLC
jgi:hypothetical protein